MAPLSTPRDAGRDDPFALSAPSLSLATTVRTRAARELRERILIGDLQAGDVIDLNAITAEFGTSRTPVREALLELSYEGLVRIAPRSKVVVLGVTDPDVRDSFELLASLAGKAGEWATQRMTDETLERMQALHDHIQANAGQNSRKLVDANWQFHRAINLAARSTRLLLLTRQAVRVVPRYYLERFPEEEEKASHDHTALLEAFRQRDAVRAREINETHVAEAGRRIADWISERRRTTAT